MTAAFVAENDIWSGAEPFALDVLHDSGNFGFFYDHSGGAEVTLWQKNAVPGKDLVIPVSFKTMDQAQRAGEALAKAFQQVREISDEETPDPETCPHGRPVIARLSRSGPPYEFCPSCGHEAIERDYDAWLGYIESKEKVRT